MPGLDFIRGYQEGGEVEDTTVNENIPVGKAVTSKGPYALPTATGAAGVDESILARMQQLINEREARKGSLSEAMLDAQAWWSGGMAGPYRALAERRAQKETDEATTFGMRRDIAQYRVAQEQARSIDRALGLSTPPAQATAPSMPTGAAQPGAAEPTAQAPQQKSLLDLVEEPGLRRSIELQARSGDRAGAMKEVQKYLAKNAADTDLIKNIKRGVNEGWLTPDMVPGFFATGLAGPSAFKLEDVRGAGGTGQVAPITTASQMVGQRSGVPGGAAAPVRPPMQGGAVPMPPVVSGGASAPVRPSMQGGAAPFATPSAPVAPAPSAPVTAAPESPDAQAPLVPTNVVTGFRPGTKEDLEAKQAYAKQQIELSAETQKPIRQELGSSIVSTKRAASTAPDSIREYDYVESLLKKHPEAVGIAQDGSATAAMIQLAKPGVTIPILGTFKVEGMEEAVAQKKLSPEAIAARNTFNSFAKRKSVDFAQNNLTGEGRGTLSNADLIMSDVAKGLSKDSPAATNLVFTILNRENDQMMLERGRLIEKLETDARRAGVPPNYEALRSSPEWKKTMADKDERIKRRFPEIFNSPEGKKRYAELEKSGGAPSSAVKKYNPKTGKVE